MIVLKVKYQNGATVSIEAVKSPGRFPHEQINRWLHVRQLEVYPLPLSQHTHQTKTMASTTSSAGRKVTSSKDLGHVLVTGGCGGLGTQIINLLLERKACSKLSAMDLRPASEPINGCEYHFGDLTNEGAMRELFIKIKPTIVIHTASPKFNMADEILYKVNVDGTKTLLRVASETGVKAFVYTSSASVISDNSTDLINADETYPLVTGKAQPEYYTNTKVATLALSVPFNR